MLKNKFVSLLGFVAVTFAASAIGSCLQQESSQGALVLPISNVAFNRTLPDWVFALSLDDSLSFYGNLRFGSCLAFNPRKL